MTERAEIQSAWASEAHAARVRFSKIGCVLAAILIPAGFTLDIFVYPTHWALFAGLRFAVTLAVLVVLALHYTDFGQRYIRSVTFTWLVFPQLAICYMIYLTDGFMSPYYAGLNLAILGMGTVLPVTLFEVILFGLMTIALYLIAGVTQLGESLRYDFFYNNIYFISTTTLVSATAVYFNEKRRFSEFRLNFELNDRNRQLAELDRVKSESFANISHELRTPLTLILAPLERLLQNDNDLSAHVADQLDLIRQNSLRLLKLVNDLLEVIRLEEGSTSLDLRPLRLDKLVDGVAKAMLPLADSRHITLTNHVVVAPCWIKGDRGALERILFNMLSNAVKFTDEGGQVWLKTHIGSDAVSVVVEDNGIGISQEYLPHVFARFRQGDSSATRRYQGTGLGLALVKELVERHGGQVNIRSVVGQGTHISVDLPLLEADRVITDQSNEDGEPQFGALCWTGNVTASPPMTLLPPAGAGHATPEANGRRTLLIIDDEPDMRRYLMDLLRADYRVLLASDGREGLDMTRQFRPDLIVLDLMLPEIDGLEVCRLIKNDAALRSTRIVLLTARAEEPSKLMALRYGADDFLTKPFSSIEVQTRLRNLARSSELEFDLQRRHGELETTLAELRKTQHQLIHSEKLNALGRLSAGLLHEINNPLNYTLTALEFARSDPAVVDEPDLKETLADIDDGMQRIRGIVKELRAFAYPSKHENTAFDLGKSIRAARQILNHDCGDICIVIDVDEELTALGSQNHVTQVVVNLLSNAFKAIRSLSAPRQGEVCIAAKRREQRIVVSVRDNGPGIEESAREQIFDPFYTTADVGQGMGMGLSVCQTIVNNHGGHLQVDSEPGAWTEFVFDLTPADAVADKNSDEAVRQAAVSP